MKGEKDIKLSDFKEEYNKSDFVVNAFFINSECYECGKKLHLISTKSKLDALKDLYNGSWKIKEDKEGYWFLCDNCE